MADQAKRIRLDIPDGPEYDQVRDMHGHTVTVFESTEVDGRRSLKIGSRTLVLQRTGVDESGDEATEIFRAQSISEPSY
ncbi:hypothetical protein [Streptosporangium sp. NBC_01756]|uniref:hypothetical protein n=1 Tax=Streptosporangium sp. NBC_01756 TaxID=2975950 RepID=UPI002DD9091C|nr:hypothetical protein [Streptosporangium sp. NBC_01756]WSC90366.1 hypothetical protein OIE48_19965 [Streptosporangium sp. NBC_01756]